jgi:hypothetical protein
MYVKDFDGNGSVEQIVATFNAGVSYPLSLRDDLIKALPYLKARFLNYKDYALKKVEDVFPAKELGDAVRLQTHTFASSLMRSNPDGSYTLVPLPADAQIAPVYGILADDFDGDRNLDLLLAGNFDGFKPEIGRASASFGLMLRGDGRGNFSAVPSPESGITIPGQARDIRRMRAAPGDLYVVTRNNDSLLAFRQQAAGSTSKPVAKR